MKETFVLFELWKVNAVALRQGNIGIGNLLMNEKDNGIGVTLLESGYQGLS